MQCTCCPVHLFKAAVGADVWYWPPTDWEEKVGKGPLAAKITGISGVEVKLVVFGNDPAHLSLHAVTERQCPPDAPQPDHWSWPLPS